MGGRSPVAKPAKADLNLSMPRGIPALVKPALLKWARDRAGLQLPDAAQKAALQTRTLESWERGDDRPTIPQLRKLGEVYKRPIAVFFLPSPPTDFDPQREFRRLSGITPQNESPALRLALRMALFRREAARDLYVRLGERIPSFKAAAHPEEGPETVGKRIRDLLGITWQQQLAWPSAYAALNAWREAIENLGILVFQTGDVELEEMRGTSGKCQTEELLGKSQSKNFRLDWTLLKRLMPARAPLQ